MVAINTMAERATFGDHQSKGASHSVRTPFTTSEPEIEINASKRAVPQDQRMSSSDSC